MDKIKKRHYDNLFHKPKQGEDLQLEQASQLPDRNTYDDTDQDQTSGNMCITKVE